MVNITKCTHECLATQSPRKKNDGGAFDDVRCNLLYQLAARICFRNSCYTQLVRKNNKLTNNLLRPQHVARFLKNYAQRVTDQKCNGVNLQFYGPRLLRLGWEDLCILRLPPSLSQSTMAQGHGTCEEVSIQTALLHRP